MANPNTDLQRPTKSPSRPYYTLASERTPMALKTTANLFFFYLFPSIVSAQRAHELNTRSRLIIFRPTIFMEDLPHHLQQARTQARIPGPPAQRFCFSD